MFYNKEVTKNIDFVNFLVDCMNTRTFGFFRNYFGRMKQQCDVVHPIVDRTAPSTMMTFNGKRVERTAAIMDAIIEELTKNKHNGHVRARGGAVGEFELDKMGIISNGKIESLDALQCHTYRPIGISTTSDMVIARNFAIHSDECFCFRKKPKQVRVMHFFDVNLIPEEHKTYIPEALGMGWPTADEYETVIHGCVPAEVYIGNIEPTKPLFRRLTPSFNFNVAFVDSIIIKNSPELLKMFLEIIYKPFSEEIGPGIRENKLTDFKKENYQNGRKTFREAYEKNRQSFFACSKTDVIKSTQFAVSSLGSR